MALWSLSFMLVSPLCWLHTWTSLNLLSSCLSSQDLSCSLASVSSTSFFSLSSGPSLSLSCWSSLFLLLPLLRILISCYNPLILISNIYLTNKEYSLPNILLQRNLHFWLILKLRLNLKLRLQIQLGLRPKALLEIFRMTNVKFICTYPSVFKGVISVPEL